MPDHTTSNADEIDRLLGELMTTFDLTRVGSSGQELGRDMVAITALGIVDRTLGNQQDVDGEPLAENRGEYKKRKDRKGLPVGVGLAEQSGDRMLSLPQITGEVTVEPEQATMTYGQSEAARRKSQWFTAGSDGSQGIEPSGAKNQPSRPFFALDQYIEAELVDLCDQLAEDFLTKLAQGGA